MNDAYTRGFIDKCAQVGVDPALLLKVSEENGLLEPILNNRMVTNTVVPTLKEKLRKMLALLSSVGVLKGDTQPDVSAVK